MFHWICPECGCEIPPSVKECPACDPKGAAVPQVAPVAAALALPVPEPVAAKGTVSTGVGFVPAIPAVLTPKPDPETELPLDPLLMMAELIRSAQMEHVAARAPAPAVPVQPGPAPGRSEQVAPERLALVLPASQPAAPEPAASHTVSAGLGELAAAIGLSEPPKTVEPVAEPEPTLDLENDPELMAETDAMAPEAETAPVEQNAAVHDPSVTLALLTPPFAERNRTPLLLPAAPTQEKFSPEPVAAQAGNPPVSERLLIDSPPSGSRLALAPLQDYSAVASRKIQPAGAKAKAFAPDPGPRTTLAGPALPPELNSFKAANLEAVLADERRPKKSASLPGWLVSLMVMLLLLAVGIAAVVYVLPSGRSNGGAKAAPAEAQASVAQVTSVAQGTSFPLAQYIEVTGFRIVVDFAKKSEIHYLVVNHSAAELSDVTVYVTLQSAKAKPGQPPVCRFSFRSPGLGPFESKEMTSSIEKLSRSVTVPEWPDLHAEVQVSQ